MLFGLEYLEGKEAIRLEGVLVDSPFFKAIVIGLSTKALLHIRLFNVQVSNKAFPVGLETLIQIFDPWLEREIELCHFNSIRKLIAPRLDQTMTLDGIKSKIFNNIPPNFAQDEKHLINADLSTASTRERALEICLFYLGRETFDRLFPKK